ncbi:SRPBCC family protein [Undibacterium arcticum]|uniref:SRPBCC family protein n=1 Tax=Undibacterium arcticum TaxID=1762892 RepID=A0ABV7EYA2_9BURK
MKFEHLIAINDPLNPLIDPLRRDQLWRGLVLRAEAPKLFVPHLDDCQLSERSAGGVSRRLRYGELVIDDRVTFEPQRQICYLVPAQNDIPESRLTMTIEEPQPEMLFVRFEYDDGQPEAHDAANAMYNDFRCSAYEESDIDTIRIIRQLAETGRFDFPLA